VVDERRYGSGLTSSVPVLPALKKALTNRTFVGFTLIQQVYFWGDGLFQGGLVYFVTLMFGLPESMMLAFGGTIVVLSLVLYPIVGALSPKVGKKNMFLIALGMMSVVMLLFAFPGAVPLPREVLAWVIVAITAIPSAITGIVPGAITNEIIREDCVRTGQPNEASFGAAAGLLTAIPSGFVGLVLPTLLLLGRSAQHPLGVQTVAVISAACMLAALVLLAVFYREKKVLASLASYGYK
jgi:GPH family glycoside/pentoside/hexuronide:cation symporter